MVKPFRTRASKPALFACGQLLLVFNLFSMSETGTANSVIPDFAFPTSPQIRTQIKNLLESKLSTERSFSGRENQVLVDDFAALTQIQGDLVSSPLYWDIFRPTDKALNGSYILHWVLSNFTTVAPSKGRTCGLSSDSEYVACSILSEKKIILTPLFFQQSRLSRITTLIHEARHFAGYPHLTMDNASEDGVVNGARGAEVAFLAAIATHCTNCRLLDRQMAFKWANQVATKIRNLNSADQSVLNYELRTLKDPLEQKYLPLVSKLRQERQYVHIMPSICFGTIPFSEFNGDPNTTPSFDCVLLYYLVDAEDAQIDPSLLNRRYGQGDTFLLVFNPVKKN
jgi:hypothetical protein